MVMTGEFGMTQSFAIPVYSLGMGLRRWKRTMAGLRKRG